MLNIIFVPHWHTLFSLHGLKYETTAAVYMHVSKQRWLAGVELRTIISHTPSHRAEYN